MVSYSLHNANTTGSLAFSLLKGIEDPVDAVVYYAVQGGSNF